MLKNSYFPFMTFSEFILVTFHINGHLLIIFRTRAGRLLYLRVVGDFFIINLYIPPSYFELKTSKRE